MGVFWAVLPLIYYAQTCRSLSIRFQAQNVSAYGSIVCSSSWMRQLQSMVNYRLLLPSRLDISQPKTCWLRKLDKIHFSSRSNELRRSHLTRESAFACKASSTGYCAQRIVCVLISAKLVRLQQRKDARTEDLIDTELVSISSHDEIRIDSRQTWNFNFVPVPL